MQTKQGSTGQGKSIPLALTVLLVQLLDLPDQLVDASVQKAGAWTRVASLQPHCKTERECTCADRSRNRQISSFAGRSRLNGT